MDVVSVEVVTEPEQGRLITRPFVLVTTVALIFFVYVGILIPIVPLYIEGPLEAGEFGIGLTVAVFAIAAIAVRPIVGRIADRFGRRVLMIGGALLAAAGGALSGHTSELWQLLGLRGVMGIGEAAVFVGAATLIADLSPTRPSSRERQLLLGRHLRRSRRRSDPRRMAARQRRRFHPGVHVRSTVRRRRGGRRLLRTVTRESPRTTSTLTSLPHRTQAPRGPSRR